jgi:hypothetical protein
LVAASVQRAATKDADHNGTSERWKTRGAFTLGAGLTIDPDTQPVSLEFSRNGQVLYSPVIPPGTFTQKRDLCPIQWRFTNPKATLPSAVGWKSASFKRSRLKGGAAGACSTTVQYALGSGTNALFAAPTDVHLRQTLRIGDHCFTALLDCVPTSGDLKCATPELNPPRARRPRSEQKVQ